MVPVPLEMMAAMTPGEPRYAAYEPPAASAPEGPAPLGHPAAAGTTPEPAGWLLWPARVIALVVVLPVRAAWELLRRASAAVGRAVERFLSALGRALAAVLRPVLSVLWVPVRWLGRTVLLPVVAVVSAVGVWLLDHLVMPVVHAIEAVARAIGRAVRGLWQHGLRPLLRGLAHPFVWAWRTAGRVLAAAWRVVTWPLVRAYRHVLTPVGHAVRAAWRAVVVAPARAVRRAVAAVLRPVRDAVRAAREQVRGQVRALLGRPR